MNLKLQNQIAENKVSIYRLISDSWNVQNSPLETTFYWHAYYFS